MDEDTYSDTVNLVGHFGVEMLGHDVVIVEKHHIKH